MASPYERALGGVPADRASDAAVALGWRQGLHRAGLLDETDLRMLVTPRFSAADRVLVVAPHPDDETLAAGITIQCALEAGAAVCIVYATDGDNNPWPQRWIEKRWSIGPGERVRWGARRRDEAAEARARLSAAGRTAEARHFGWPDQGLTDALMHGDHAVALLGDELAGFAPTAILMPALDDRHPDHSALHVMIELALLRTGRSCQRYCYLVHGARSAIDDAVDPGRFARKTAALEAYVSQLSLSRRRLHALVARPERFDALAHPRAPDLDGSGTMRIPLGKSRRVPWQHEILLVVAAREVTWRLRGTLPRFAAEDAQVALVDPSTGVEVAGRVVAGNLHVVPPSAPVAAWAKLHRAGSRIVVFDRTRWHGAHHPVRLPLPSIERDAVTGLG